MFFSTIIAPVDSVASPSFNRFVISATASGVGATASGVGAAASGVGAAASGAAGASNVFFSTIIAPVDCVASPSFNRFVISATDAAFTCCFAASFLSLKYFKIIS